MQELLRVRDVLGADQIDERDEIELVNILSGLIKDDGTIAVEDLRKLTSDIISTDHLEDVRNNDDEDVEVTSKTSAASSDVPA
jgi:hypothetical protein